MKALTLFGELILKKLILFVLIVTIGTRKGGSGRGLGFLTNDCLAPDLLGSQYSSFELCSTAVLLDKRRMFAGLASNLCKNIHKYQRECE